MLDTNGNEFEIPDYTIKQIRDAIPAHCFERSAVKGFYFVFRDIASLAATFYLFHNYVTPETIPSTAVRAALWAGYTVVQVSLAPASGSWLTSADTSPSPPPRF